MCAAIESVVTFLRWEGVSSPHDFCVICWNVLLRFCDWGLKAPNGGLHVALQMELAAFFSSPDAEKGPAEQVGRQGKCQGAGDIQQDILPLAGATGNKVLVDFIRSRV